MQENALARSLQVDRLWRHSRSTQKTIEARLTEAAQHFLKK
jgi:hypothetical protein